MTKSVGGNKINIPLGSKKIIHHHSEKLVRGYRTTNRSMYGNICRVEEIRYNPFESNEGNLPTTVKYHANNP